MPWPSCPTRFAAGTRTSSSSMYVVPAETWPATLSRRIVTPG